jgi:hypothetical protein
MRPRQDDVRWPWDQGRRRAEVLTATKRMRNAQRVVAERGGDASPCSLVCPPLGASLTQRRVQNIPSSLR